MMQVGARSLRATRKARSIRLGNCSGTIAVWTNWWQTSLNRELRSTFCWYEPPMADRLVCPTMATTGT